MSKTALITGASSGIGAELARIHAGKGGILILVARRKDRLEALKSELGTEALILSEDLTDSEAPARTYAAVNEAGLKVDYLINNAGFGGRGKFHEMPWENILSMVQVNAIALAGMMRAFLPDFVARGYGKSPERDINCRRRPWPIASKLLRLEGICSKSQQCACGGAVRHRHYRDELHAHRHRD